MARRPPECPNALYHFLRRAARAVPTQRRGRKNTISGSDILTLPSAHCHGPIFEGPSKMGPWQCALGSVKMSDPEIVFFRPRRCAGTGRAARRKNGRVRLGIPAARGPNCNGRSKNRGPPSLLQDCVLDRAERTARKDGALFSRRATKSGCLRLLQVKSTLWDYNTIRLRGGMVPRYSTYSSHSCPGSGSKNSLSQKRSASATPAGEGRGAGPY